MEIKFLKQFEGKQVKLILRNGFHYSFITFKINEEGLLEFQDKFNEFVVVDPNSISVISKVNEGNKNEKFERE